MVIIERESDKDLIKRLQEKLRKSEITNLRTEVKNKALLRGLKKIVEFEPDNMVCCDYEELKDIAAELIEGIV